MSEETKDFAGEAFKIAQEAQSPKVFNLSDLIKGRSYPLKDVDIYLDDQAAMELYDIASQLEYITDPEEAKPLEDRAEELKTKIAESKLTFRMRGVSQEAIEVVLEKTNAQYGLKKGDDGTGNPEWLRDYISNLISMNIMYVIAPDGSEDHTPFNYERTEELRKNLPASEWSKLVETMHKLTLAGGYFEQITDAGFLPKS